MVKRKDQQSYFVRSGLKQISLLRKYFQIEGQGDRVRVIGEISPASIKEFYKEYFASVRPPQLGENKILPKRDTSVLRAWYVGQPDANVLLNLIVRHALYVDQIVLVDPFITLPHEDIQVRPQIWARTIINRALCICALEDWIKEEIILLVPSILHYHPELYQLLANMPHEDYPPPSDKQRQDFERWVITRFLVNEPPEGRESALDVLATKGRPFTRTERADLLSEAEQYAAKYPIRFRLSSAFFEKHFKGTDKKGQVLDFSIGLPPLFTPHVAEEAGAFLVFEHRFLYDWHDKSQKTLDTRSGAFQQIALAFQGLDFPFLHNVPLGKALDLRKKGYLHSFRVYLRDLWSTVSKAEGNESLDAKIAEFSDRLKAEYTTLKREWENIQKELRVKAITSGLTVGLSAGAAIVIGNISWTVGAIATASAGLLKEQIHGYAGSAEKLQQTHQKPLSVFLTLEH